MERVRLTEIILEYIHSNKMTITEFAELAGCGKSFISKITKSKNGVSYIMLKSMAKAMNMKVIDLVAELEDEELSSYKYQSDNWEQKYEKLKKITGMKTVEDWNEKLNELKEVQRVSPREKGFKEKQLEVELYAIVYEQLKKQSPSPIPVGTLKRDWIASQTTIGKITVQKYLTGEYAKK